MLTSQGLPPEEMQAVTFVSPSGKINLVYGSGSLLWEMQRGWSAVQHYPLVISLVTTLSKRRFSRLTILQGRLPL